jgi:hypothetical protein
LALVQLGFVGARGEVTLVCVVQAPESAVSETDRRTDDAQRGASAASVLVPGLQPFLLRNSLAQPGIEQCHMPS